MGGDDAPDVVVKGALAAISCEYEIVLVGDKERLESMLGSHLHAPGIRVVHASQVIGMDETPSTALEKKKDSSLLVAARLVKQGEAHALVSAGNTGALMAGALLTIGRTSGIRRPAIAVTWPTAADGSDGRTDQVLVLDCGANAECKPEYLVQFGHMGSVYVERVMRRRNPRVGLLNIGGEAGKGNTFVNTTYPLLEKAGLNFIGNVEPQLMMRGDVDVVVTDGFVGNSILKTGEAVAEMILNMIRAGVKQSWRAKIGAWLMKPVFMQLKSKVDPAAYGGALLLGLKVPVVKAHGRSNAVAISNAIRVAARAVSEGVVGHIAQSLQSATAREKEGGDVDAARSPQA
jgi:glycerol-3-phosphate acyltransferase PlsX